MTGWLKIVVMISAILIVRLRALARGLGTCEAYHRTCDAFEFSWNSNR